MSQSKVYYDPGCMTASNDTRKRSRGNRLFQNQVHQLPGSNTMKTTYVKGAPVPSNPLYRRHAERTTAFLEDLNGLLVRYGVHMEIVSEDNHGERWLMVAPDAPRKPVTVSDDPPKSQTIKWDCASPEGIAVTEPRGD